MKTFYVEEEAQTKPCEEIKPHGRQGERSCENKITSRKDNAKKHVRGDTHGALFEGIGKEVEQIVECAACDTAGGAQKKRMKLLHVIRLLQKSRKFSFCTSVLDCTHLPRCRKASTPLRESLNFQVRPVDSHTLSGNGEQDSLFRECVHTLDRRHRDFLPLLDSKNTLIVHIPFY